MQTPDVNIDFAVLEKTFRAFVLSKAMLANSTVVYVENGKLIEEDPRTSKKRILNSTFSIKK